MMLEISGYSSGIYLLPMVGRLKIQMNREFHSGPVKKIKNLAKIGMLVEVDTIQIRIQRTNLQKMFQKNPNKKREEV